MDAAPTTTSPCAAPADTHFEDKAMGGSVAPSSRPPREGTIVSTAPPAPPLAPLPLLPHPLPQPQATTTDRRPVMMKRKSFMSHRSFFTSNCESLHTLQRSCGSRQLMKLAKDDDRDDANSDDDSDNAHSTSSCHSIDATPQLPHLPPPSWRSLAMRFFSQINETTEEEGTPVSSRAAQPPDSEVERIVQRLEHRNADRARVPAEVKSQFLRLCKDACLKRQRVLENGGLDDSCGSNGAHNNDSNNNNSNNNNKNNGGGETISSCILRSDVIQIRQSIRLQVENQSKRQRVADGIRVYLGFRCHCKVLLHVLNRAVDLIDESSRAAQAKKKTKKTRGRRHLSLDSLSGSHNIAHPSNIESCKENTNIHDGNNDNEWFYYKDFAFYSLKIESNYPWMRHPSLFSILITLAFYIFSPVLWCSLLHDPNICPQNRDRWPPLSALFFASATMSTVGYGDVSVFVGSDDLDAPAPQTWRIFIAILFMIASLVVSVVGFQAGLDSQLYPFLCRLDVFGKCVYEILKYAKFVIS